VAAVEVSHQHPMIVSEAAEALALVQLQASLTLTLEVSSVVEEALAKAVPEAYLAQVVEALAVVLPLQQQPQALTSLLQTKQEPFLHLLECLVAQAVPEEEEASLDLVAHNKLKQITLEVVCSTILHCLEVKVTHLHLEVRVNNQLEHS